MNISLNWLNSYLDRPIDAAEADRVLTDLGFPLDGLEVGDSDALLDVEVTSNRGDCLSHVGMAREIAAGTDRTLKPPVFALAESDDDAVESLTSVELADDASDACTLYTARVIRGVKIAPSPDWLLERLEAIGQRPVNNVVDITNFVQHELGQPLHAFDMNLLAERRIVVRMARAGEAFTAIDGTQHTLGPSMLIIADADRPVAVAGVMGGAESEVADSTTDILLESARFDPLSIRTTSRALKLTSESSYRFERKVDAHGVEAASQRAAQLIVEIAGGTLAPGVVTVGQPLPQSVELALRPDRCTALLGYDLTTDQMIALLKPLGLNPVWDGTVIQCTIPSHRQDLRQEVDLIEEVARVQGYDHIDVEPQMHITVRGRDGKVEARRRIGQFFAAHGFCETITFSTVSEAAARPFLEADVALAVLEDEQKKAEPVLRTSILPSLLTCRKSNQDAGNQDVRLFEIGAVFGRQHDGYIERRDLALLVDATEPDRALRDVRGTIDELVVTLGRRAIFEEIDHQPGYLAPAGRILDADHPDQVVGQFGMPTESLLAQFDLQSPVVTACLDYTWLVDAYPPTPEVGGVPRFPAVERDLSIIVDESIRWQAIADAIEASKPALLEELQFVTVYRGKPIPKGRKSVSLRMRYRDPNTTLQSDQVDEQVDAVVARLAADLGAELRAT